MLISEMSSKKKEEFKSATDKVIEFMNDNPDFFHPHVKIEIDSNSVTVLEMQYRAINNEFLKD